MDSENRDQGDFWLTRTLAYAQSCIESPGLGMASAQIAWPARLPKMHRADPGAKTSIILDAMRLGQSSKKMPTH
jgi:hypothetical protein